MDSVSVLQIVLKAVDNASAQLEATSAQLKSVGDSAKAASGGLDTVGASGDKAAEGLAASGGAADKNVAAMDRASMSSKNLAGSQKEAAAASDASGASFSKIGMGAAAVAIGIGYIADKTLKAAGNFQSSLTALVTGAGESQANISRVSAGMLQLADYTGTASDKLAQGMYLIESAGYHGAEGLLVLKAAAEGAKVGNADLQTTAAAVTTVMHDYGLGANNAGEATNFLVSTVANGKMHMDDLVSSLGTILPTASQLHVPLAQVGGAMSTMTVAGIDANRAATALRFTMSALVAPTSTAKKALTDVGLSSSQVADTLTHQGLMQALQLITDSIGKKFPAGSAAYFAALKDITGGTRGLQAVLGTTGTNMQTFIDNTAKISAATSGAGNAVIGWSNVQQTFNFKMDQAKESINTMGIALGTALLPAVSAIAVALAQAIVPLSEFINTHTQLAATAMITGFALASTILVTIGVAKAIDMSRKAYMLLIGTTEEAGLAMKAFGAISATVDAILSINPIILITLALAALAIGTYELITHWQQLPPIFNPVKNLFREISAAMNMVKEAASGANPAVGATGKEFKALASALQPVRELATGVNEEIKQATIIIGQQLNGALKAAMTSIKSSLAPAVKSLSGAFAIFGYEVKPLVPYLKALGEAVGILAAVIVVAPIMIFVGLLVGLAAILKVIAPVIGLVITALSQFVTAIVGVAAILTGAFFQAIIVAENALVGFINGTVTAVHIIVSWFGFMYSSTVSILNGLVGFFRALPSMILGALGDLGGLLYNSGRDLIQGLINGINNMVGGAINTVKNLAGDITGAINTALGRHSPSRVFTDIGADIGAGLIQGIEGTKVKVQEATTGLATAAVGGVNTASVNNSSSLVNNNLANSRSSITLNVTVSPTVFAGTPAEVKTLATTIYQSLQQVARQHGAADQLPNIGVLPQ